MYLAIQMFFDPNQIGVPCVQDKAAVVENDGGLSYKVWQVVKGEIERIKENVETQGKIDKPMLVMQ